MGGEEKAATASSPAAAVGILAHAITSGGRPGLPALVSAFTAETMPARLPLLQAGLSV